jgi:hypothetical protein
MSSSGLHNNKPANLPGEKVEGLAREEELIKVH